MSSSSAYASPRSREQEQSAPAGKRKPDTLTNVLFWTVVLAATFLAAFVLQFAFPLKQPVFSPSYTVGGNNRVGALAVAVVSLLTCAACLRWPAVLQGLRKPQLSPGMNRFYLLVAVGSVTVFSIVLGALVVRSGTYYADSGYFITQLRSGLVFHRALYRDVEFAYGPLLYWWPALVVRALRPFGCSIATGYMVSLVVVEAVGTAMLYRTVCALPMSGRMKTIAFTLLVVLTLDPQAGLNYTAFRFILPAFSLVLLARQQRRSVAAMVALVAAALNFAVSPELGVAFSAGAACYGLYRALYGDKRWLAVSAGAAVGAALFGFIMGGDYFRTMAEFAKGGYNEILEPAPHIYVLLACAAGLAPLAVAAAIRTQRRYQFTGRKDHSGVLIGLFIAGLTMLAPALGRCDPLHVSFNGWALFLLAFIAVDQMGRTGQRTWMVVAVLFCMYSISQEFTLEKGPIARVALHRPDPLEKADLPRLTEALHGQRVAFPLNHALTLFNQLTALNLYEPQYLCIPPADAESEQRVVQDMRRANYAMVPNNVDLVIENETNNSGLRYRMRSDYKYQVRRKPFMQGAITVAELHRHWQPVGIYGSYTLYRKLS